jgi:hypothetical protein
MLGGRPVTAHYGYPDPLRQQKTAMPPRRAQLPLFPTASSFLPIPWLSPHEHSSDISGRYPERADVLVRTGREREQSRCPQAKGTTTRARVPEVIKLLKKSTKPAKLSSLKSSMKSWFKPPLDDKAVDAIVQSLQSSKKIVVSGTKVAYALG